VSCKLNYTSFPYFHFIINFISSIQLKYFGPVGGFKLKKKNSKVLMIKSRDRALAVEEILKVFNLENFSGQKVALKANYNSADPFPASTHPETLQSLIDCLEKSGTGNIVLLERSGMGNTRKVLEKRGVFKLSSEMGFEVVVLDEIERDDWVRIERDGTH